jgi:hypothetical protein
METRIRPIENSFLKKRELAFMDRTARKMLFSMMKHLKKGRIHFREENLRKTFGRLGNDAPLEASVTVLSPNFYSRIVFGGSVGGAKPICWGCGKRMT